MQAYRSRPAGSVPTHTPCASRPGPTTWTPSGHRSAPDPRLRPFRSRDEECVAKATAWANYGMGELHRLGGRGTVLQGKELEGIHKCWPTAPTISWRCEKRPAGGTSQATQATFTRPSTTCTPPPASMPRSHQPVPQQVLPGLYTRLMNLDTQKQTLNAMSGNVQRVGAAAHNFATPADRRPCRVPPPPAHW